MPDPPLAKILRSMERDWDQRARKNARHFIANSREDWTEEEFLASGRENVRQQILNDMLNICQGRDPNEMRVLEIGCGAGRLTHALAEVFGEVHGVDVSGEMIARARLLLHRHPNVFLHRNNGMDLSVLGSLTFDFAFSYLVFQHIPSREIIESYFREVSARLRDGALFKCQVQGRRLPASRLDTWNGAPLTEDDVIGMAGRTGFEPRHLLGAGTQNFWLWLFKRPA